MSSTFSNTEWETRTINLPGGSTLPFQLTPTFLSHVREHFKLGPDAYVSDTLLKEFFLRSVRGAVEKAEVEAFRDSIDQQNVVE